MKSSAKKETVKEQDRDKTFDLVRMNPSDVTKFTGVARSVVCFNNNGFKNFKIITLYIENGVVQKTEQSDPYAHFELNAKLEVQNQLAVWNLNDKWENGKTLLK